MDANNTRMKEGIQAPAKLWKYREWGLHAAAMIEHGTLYFANRDEINDPFEFRWLEKWPAQRGVRSQMAKELCAAAFPDDSPKERRLHYYQMANEMEVHASKARKRKGRILSSIEMRFGIFSVSSSYTHLTMWSHYANSHRGVCLGIRTDRMQEKLFRSVIYSDELPCINALNYLDNKRDSMRYAEITSQKSTDWSYEKEWRTIGEKGPRDFPGCVSDVIIGSRCSENQRRAIRASIERSPHHITQHRCRLNEEHYSLDIYPPVMV